MLGGGGPITISHTTGAAWNAPLPGVFGPRAPNQHRFPYSVIVFALSVLPLTVLHISRQYESEEESVRY